MGFAPPLPAGDEILPSNYADRSSLGARLLGWAIAALALAAAIALAARAPAIAAGDVPSVSWAWVPSLDAALSFRLDGLSLLMGLLVTGVGALVFVYAQGYLRGHPSLARFFLYLGSFLLAMLGLVLTDDLLTLFVFWELTSITSYLLIGFASDRAEAREAALQALLVTAAGGLALLAGLVLLGLAADTWTLSEAMQRGARIQADPRYPWIVGLVLLGAFTKSAQFPFHFWLPGAMAAPTPVSAYLHSATMVKAGVYLVARLSPGLGGSQAWSLSLSVVGALSLAVGAWLAWQAQDLKRILAYSTVASLGALMLLLGLDDPLAYKAAILLLLAHALYKGALFMVAGNVDHQAGSRDLARLGGLRRALPLTFAAGLLAGASAIGLPPSLGFLAKEVWYDAALHAPLAPTLWIGVSVLANVALLVAVGLVVLRPFLGRAASVGADVAREAPWTMCLGPLALGALGFVLVLALGPLGDALVGPATSAVLGTESASALKLWHGWNAALALSLLTLGAGAGAYVLRDRLRAAAAPLAVLERYGPARGYRAILAGVVALAEGQTRLLQSGYLRRYVRIAVLTTVALVGFGLWRLSGGRLDPGLGPSRLEDWVLGIVIVSGALLVVAARSRLVALAALGVTGFGMAMLFVLYGAPDLAMTQFAVETLTVVLMILVIYRLPRMASYAARRSRVVDAAVALVAGLTMALLVLVAQTVNLGSRLSPWFVENSLPLGKGRNVVNVILVDFRALDTLGEIFVLAVAAIGVFALMASRDREGREPVPDPAGAATPDASPEPRREEREG